ncbi:MAG: bifunctional DNA-formamidopyrimidine glycosylase/DNA-(apurinic or apyrimidinic site) lyase [Acidimicrobiales bacterium]|nr:bifunctional DNA-formamidopyrimidine glycosylase/DNA-(apurinic or apyrimidinic site) lyase [Acidimicrobiales bacterium]
MPELPEVETIRRELDREVVGKRVKSVDVTGEPSSRGAKASKELVAKLEGAKISGVERRGKYLVFKLDTGDLLVCHLDTTGQLRRAQAKDAVADGTRVVVTFTQAGQLRYIDPRGSGELFVTTPDGLVEDVPELGELGFDPVETPISWTVFGEMLVKRSNKLKALLMDQRFMAGLGAIYSDEILFASGLRYDRPANSLSTQEIRRLYRSVVETLHDAVKYRGSTLADQGYVDLFGKAGDYQEHHKVYARDGLACRRCRTPIQKARFSNGTTYYCPQCQV